MEVERWCKIEGYPNYSVSDHGKVLNDVTGKILKPRNHSGGYLNVCLCNGIKKQFFVHRLVAHHFCEKNNHQVEVDHIDRDKTNNHFSNLRWVTKSQNGRNKPKKFGATSQYVGVHFFKRTAKWQARLKLNGKAKHLGFFDTEEEAAHAFRAAVAFHHLEEFYPQENNLSL